MHFKLNVTKLFQMKQDSKEKKRKFMKMKKEVAARKRQRKSCNLLYCNTYNI